MPTPAKVQSARRSGRGRVDVIASGLPDPRPVTDYTVEYTEEAGESVVSIKLEQPCIIRNPAWRLISCASGESTKCLGLSIKSNDEFVYRFGGLIDPALNFIEAPYQDMEIQNFAGGFVAPGAKWFRTPILPPQ